MAHQRRLGTDMSLIQSLLASYGGTLVSSPRGQTLLVADGDSITEGGGVTASWVKLYANDNLGRVPFTMANNQAVGGSYLSSVVGRAAAVDALLTSMPWASSKILTVLIGTNNINPAQGGYYPSNSAGFLTDLFAYADARRAAGWKFLLCTITPRSSANVIGYSTTLVAWDAWRNAVNAGIRAAVGTHCDGVIDFAADPVIGAQASAESTTYYSDGLHPKDLTHGLMRDVAKYVISSFTVAVAQPASFSTWSPTDKNASIVLTNSNRTMSNPAGGYISGRGNVWRDFGKHTFQIIVTGSSNQLIGLCNQLSPLTTFVGSTAPAMALYVSGGGVFSPGTTVANAPDGLYVAPGIFTGDVDLDAGKLWIRNNGVATSGANPVTGASPNFTFTPNTAFWVCCSPVDTAALSTLPANNGEFLYPRASGYGAW